MSQKYWERFKREAFLRAHQSIGEHLIRIESELMNEIDVCSVAELHQRFRDFMNEADRIKLRVELASHE